MAEKPIQRRWTARRLSGLKERPAGACTAHLDLDLPTACGPRSAEALSSPSDSHVRSRQSLTHDETSTTSTAPPNTVPTSVDVPNHPVMAVWPMRRPAPQYPQMSKRCCRMRRNNMACRPHSEETARHKTYLHILAPARRFTVARGYGSLTLLPDRCGASL
jgi:hypothetical protein